MLACARLVGDELIGCHHEGHFGFRYLNRLRGHVRHHVRIAVEAVSPGTSTPRAAGEVDIDKWLARFVITTDRNAGIAPVARRRHLFGEHHGKRPEHAIHHPEPSQSARRAGGGQYAVANRARRADYLDRAIDAFIARDVLRKHGAHCAIRSRFGEGERIVDRAFHLRVRAGPVDYHRVRLTCGS